MKRKNIFQKTKGGEKMNNWKLAILPLVILFVVGIAQAAVTSTLTAPAAGGYVSGTYTLTCTGAGIDNATTTLDNATFYYGSTKIGTNATESNATTWTYIWDSTAVSDHIADFKCVVTTSDDVEVEDASADCIIDNTVPACTWVLPTGSNDEIEPGDTLSVTLTGTGGEDSTCTALTFGSNIYTPTLATGGGSCSWQDDGKPPEGIYDMSIVVSDGTNSTTCSLSNIVVQEEENIAGINKQASDLMDKEKEEIQKESTDKRFRSFAIILGLCLLAWIVFGKKK